MRGNQEAGLTLLSSSSQEIVKQSVVEVSDRHVYDISQTGLGDRPVTKNGPLDRRMGVSSNNARCETCDRAVKDCNGHFGYVELALPAFHIGFLKKIIEVLHCICKVAIVSLLLFREGKALTAARNAQKSCWLTRSAVLFSQKFDGPASTAWRRRIL